MYQLVDGYGRERDNASWQRSESLVPIQTESLNEAPLDTYINETDNSGAADSSRETALLYSRSSKQRNGQSIVITAHLKLKSLYSRVGMILALATFVLLCITALIILHQLDNNDHGFTVDSTSKATQYAWKFGPTAIFVLAIAFWRQVDYRIKTEAPWKQIAKGYTPASKSILLDYISPILPSVFIRCIRNRHWEVVVSITVFALLKLAVFFSTGLLNPQPVVIPYQPTIVALDIGNNTYPNNSATNLNDAGRAYASTQRNLPWPEGASPEAAYQQLAPNNKLRTSTNVTADVLALYPWLECEEAADTNFSVVVNDYVVGKRDVNGPVISETFTWNSTHTSGVATLQDPIFCDVYNRSATCPASQISYFLGTTKWEAGDLEQPGAFGQDNAFLLIVYSLISKTSPGTVPYNASATNSSQIVVTDLRGYGWIQKLDWASTLACKTNYAVETGRLVSSWSQDRDSWVLSSLSSNMSDTGNLMGNYSSANLTEDVFGILGYSIHYVDDISGSTGAALTPWFEIMLNVANLTSLETFQDAKNMIAPANAVFKGLASVWLGSQAYFPNNPSTNGTYTYQAVRLRISSASFWSMQICLAMAFLILILLIIIHKTHHLPCHSDRLLQDVRTLSYNRDSLATLSEVGSASEEEISQHLSQDCFRISLQSSRCFRIESKSSTTITHATGAPTAKNSASQTWQTVSSKPWFIGLLVLVSALVIATLEIIQKISDREGGIPSSMSRSRAQDVTSFVTALVMLTISTLFSSADFTVAGLVHYLRMRRKAVPLNSLRSIPLQQLPLVCIAQQLQLRQFGIAFVMISALLGSFLTILGSGLYSIRGDSIFHSTNVTTTDTFDLGTTLSVNGSSALAFTFLEHNNASYVSGTYDEFAYPLVALDMSDPTVAAILASPQSQTTIEVESPVLRASLNCTKILTSNLTLLALPNPIPNPNTENAFFPPLANITSIGTLPQECQLLSPAYGDSIEYQVNSFDSGSGWLALPQNGSNDASGMGWGAQMASLIGILRDNSSSLASSGSDYSTHFPPGCPSIAFTIGSWVVNGSDTSNITRMVCDQYWQEVPATLTFNVPKMDLNISSPPVLHEDRATIISRLSWNFTNVFEDEQPLNIAVGPSQALDPFYTAVVYGIDGVPFDEMFGEQNYDRFFNATQHVYRQYMAQVIGNDMRTSDSQNLADNSTAPIGQILGADILDPNGIRIVQDRTTTIVLQSTLAAMIVFLLIGCRDLLACGKILTHSPFHIAGRMSLLAGSNLVRQLDGSRSEKELMDQYGQLRLRLGWWQPESERNALSVDGSTTRNKQPAGTTRIKKISNVAYGKGDHRGFKIRRKPLSSTSDIELSSNLSLEADTTYDNDRDRAHSGRMNHDQMLLLTGEKSRFGIDLADQ